MRKKADTHKEKLGLHVSLWQRIRRTPYQALVSVFMVFITLFILSIFLLLAGSSSAIISHFETKPQVTVFFKDTEDKAAIDQLIEKLRSTGKVSQIKYVSQEEALRIYQEQNKDDPLLLEMVTADILPASIEVSAKSPKYLSEIVQIVEREPGIDEVVFQKEIVDTLISWTTTIRRIGMIFLLFLFIASFLILFSSIGMKIAYRKDEIEILKLVGATSWYIKRPFILEGVVYGVVGATLAFFLASVIILYIQPFMASFLKGISPLSFFAVEDVAVYIWPPNTLLFAVLWGILATVGFFIGLLSSLFAVSRYLKN